MFCGNMLFVVNSLEDTLFRSPSLCGDISLCGTFSSGDISLFVVHSLGETSHSVVHSQMETSHSISSAFSTGDISLSVVHISHVEVTATKLVLSIEMTAVILFSHQYLPLLLRWFL